jgi:hypothetical protein
MNDTEFEKLLTAYPSLKKSFEHDPKARAQMKAKDYHLVRRFLDSADGSSTTIGRPRK